MIGDSVDGQMIFGTLAKRPGASVAQARSDESLALRELAFQWKAHKHSPQPVELISLLKQTGIHVAAGADTVVAGMYQTRCPRGT